MWKKSEIETQGACLVGPCPSVSASALASSALISLALVRDAGDAQLGGWGEKGPSLEKVRKGLRGREVGLDLKAQVGLGELRQRPARAWWCRAWSSGVGKWQAEWTPLAHDAEELGIKAKEFGLYPQGKQKLPELRNRQGDPQIFPLERSFQWQNTDSIGGKGHWKPTDPSAVPVTVPSL